MTTTASGITSLTAVPSPTTLTTASSSLGSGVTSTDSLTSGTSSPTSTTSPSNVLPIGNLFPTPTNTSPPAEPSRRGISQTVLMWIFAVIAVGLLSSIMIWRYTCSKFKRRRRVAGSTETGDDGGRIWTGFPGLGSGSGSGLESPSILRTSDVPLGNQHVHRQSRPIILSTSFLHSGLVPVVHRDGTLIHEARPHLHPHHHRHHHHQRVRGADVDEGGRRRGGEGGSDAGGSIALEELPAYHEAGKSPPGYQAVAFLPNYLPVGRDSEGGGVSASQSQSQAAQAQSQNENPSPSQGQSQSPSQSLSQSPDQSQPPPVPYASRPNFENENDNPIPD